MNYRLLLLYTLLGILTLSITADQLPDISLKIPLIQPENSQLRFIENAGQWDEQIQYRVPLKGGSLLLENQRLTWFFSQFPASFTHHGAASNHHHPSPNEEETIKMHAYQVNFQGANPHSYLESSHRFEAYHNYFFGDDPSQWKGGVPLYGIVTYKELYAGIDMRMYGIADAIKYDFIVKPFTSADVIQLQYEGAELSLKDGNLQIHTSLRDVTELAPIAYQEIEGEKVEVICEYRLEKDLLTFEFPNGYDNRYKLVIDPTLIFSTFMGSTMDNWGFTATYDQDGNAYAGGIIYDDFLNNTGYPTTLGAFQTSYRGGMADIVISKFDGTGNNLLYSTFLGGNNHDQPHSLVVNDANELFVLGRTNSPNFPTTFAAFDSDINGDYDLLVTKFNAAGTNLLASTFIGGSGKDGVNITEDALTFSNLKYNYGDDARGEIILDDLGNVYIASPTSSFDFPTTAGAFQQNSAGLQDGCIIKLTPDLNTIIWSSYLGGNNYDAAYAMQVDNEYNVYVTGGTMSNNFPTTAGAYQPNYQGFNFDNGYDGFITKISNDGSSILTSTYIGTNQNDQSYFIQLDDDNDVYIYGQTTGSWPIVNPAAGNVFFTPNGKQFITKLDNDLTNIVYSTVFGGTNTLVPNISPTAFLVDKCENVYASGWGGSTNSNITSVFDDRGLTFGLPTTNDAIQRSTAGDDIYLIVLSRDAQDILYGTFFGGSDFFGNGREHLDGGTCRFDRNGVIYHAVCAGCGGTNTFPTTPGAWSNTNESTNCNMAVFKIAFDLAGISSDFVPRDTLNDPITNFQGCAPLTVNFENTSSAIFGSTTTSYFWDFDDNGNSSNQFEPTYTFRDSGTYNVMLVIRDPQSCNESDTSFHVIEVFPPVAVDAGPGFSFCSGDSVSLTGSGVGDNLIYQWTPATGLSDPTIPNPRAAPASTTIYTLRVTNENGCTGTDTLTVLVAPQLTTNIGNDTTICANETLQLDASNPEAQSYSWSPTTFLDDPTSPTPTISGLDVPVTYIVSVISPIGCNSMDTITVNPFDISLMPDTSICVGEAIPLLATATDSNAVFSWAPTTGLDDPNIINPTATPLTTTTYTLTATRPTGCSVSQSVTIQVSPILNVDAGANDTICEGESLQLLANGGTNYQWSPNINISDVNIPDPIVNPSVSTTYVVTVTNNNGCAGTDSVLIEVGQAPIVSAGEDQTICQGEAAQLLASGADTYEWTGPDLTDPTISDPFAQPQTDATYTVIGTNIWGCTAEDEVVIAVEEAPIATIQGPSQICLGDTVTLRSADGETYIWSTGDTAESIVVTPSPNSLYYATAMSQGCAGTSDSIRINVSTDFPSVLFLPSSSEGFAPVPIKFFNLTSFASRYEWDFGTGAPTSTEIEPTYTFPSAGDYRVRLIAWSASGCKDTAYWDLRVNNVTVHIPSAFTPNNDGFNDEFFIGQLGLSIIKIRIFTRWGQMIYESDDPNFVWDGTYKGRILPEGVYTYAFKGLGENNIVYEKSGTITLVK